MPQIGSEKNPVVFNPKNKIKIRSKFYKHEDKEKFDENYERLFRNPDKPPNHNGAREN